LVRSAAIIQFFLFNPYNSQAFTQKLRWTHNEHDLIAKLEAIGIDTKTGHICRIATNKGTSKNQEFHTYRSLQKPPYGAKKSIKLHIKMTGMGSGGFR
jgi:hypothetical protein